MFKSESKLKYVLIPLVIIGLAYFLVLCFMPKYSITGQLLRQEHVIAKAEAENIQSFIEGIGKDLILLSQEENIINPGSGTEAVLRSFVDKWGKNQLIAGISLTDKEGIVIYNYSNISPTEIGTSLADRDHFIWAKAQTNSDNYLVGRSAIARFGINKDRFITPVSAPILKDGVFLGTVTSAIRTPELTKYFLGMMNVSEDTDTYLLGRDGYVLFNSRNPEDAKIDINEANIDNLFVDNTHLNQVIYKALSKGKDGSIVSKYLNPITGKSEIHALVYYPVTLPGRHWLVVLATPATEVTRASMPIYIQQISAVLFLALVIFSAGIIFLRKK